MTSHVPEQPGHSISDSLIDYLRRKELLLLLDNVEHLVQASAELAQHLLAHCARLKIVVTGTGRSGTGQPPMAATTAAA